MSLSPGTRLGPYEIVSPLGAGGMGEVYRAKDTRLKRTVAIKVLLDSVANDADRLARFQREAEVLAALNHPNIAHIHGLETIRPSAGSGPTGLTALVMELVEGDDLSALIARGPIPLSDALPIAKQIAEALEAAHERGIIHRDLKPGNVKVRDDGVVKVLDFGLAKAVDPVSSSGVGATNSPTMTGRATQLGMILGTAAYMSPEQAKGKAVDKRADIWAFGVVLYEMLTGCRLFDAEDISDTLAAVLRQEIALTALPAPTPPRLRALVRDCLVRDPKQRLRDIGDARLVLDRIIAGATDELASPATMPVAVVPPWRRALPWVLAGVAAATTIVALAVSVVHFREAPPAVAERMRLEFPFPKDTVPAERSVPALSPDGRKVAFIATGTDGRRRMWIRSLDASDAKPLDGTEGASGSPFWSPDSRAVVYLGQKQTLRKIDVSGGPSQVICEAPPYLTVLRGGLWTATGHIVFGTLAGSGAGGLFQCPAAGGVATPLTTVLKQESSHAYPVLLPDGEHFLYARVSYEVGIGGVFLGSLDMAPSQQAGRRLLPDIANVAYVPSALPGTGFVLFVREGTLFARSFDERRLEFIGEPQPVAERVGVASPEVFAFFSAAASGIIVYQQEGYFENRQLVWVNRQGQAPVRVGQPGSIRAGRLSRNGSYFAYSRHEGQSSNLWLFDFQQENGTPLTRNRARNWNATWSPDARQILYASIQSGRTGIYQKAVGGTGEEQLVLPESVPVDWSPDGRFVLFTRDNDLWVLPDPRASSDRTPMPVTHTTFAEGDARYSPNGNWVAVQSNESGQSEIYVQSFNASSKGVSLGASKTPVSRDGGSAPHWPADGNELFYLAKDRWVMAVKVTATGIFRAEAPQRLFQLPESASWDVRPDGQRFLLVVPAGKNTPPPFTVVLNWQAGLRK